MWTPAQRGRMAGITRKTKRYPSDLEGSKNPLALSCFFGVDWGWWKMKQPGFFDVEERLARLSGLGDQLEAFSRTCGLHTSDAADEEEDVDLGDSRPLD
ncbi:hypothetical protein, partial [Acetobacter pasteurianus]|uniref:hypothetical protein n=1 Tax=Acetobacter pasteurianus TaxID=438 RepID=UPI0012DAA617